MSGFRWGLLGKGSDSFKRKPTKKGDFFSPLEIHKHLGPKNGGRFAVEILLRRGHWIEAKKSLSPGGLGAGAGAGRAADLRVLQQRPGSAGADADAGRGSGSDVGEVCLDA